MFHVKHRLHLKAYGTVQGVGFRAHVLQVGQRLGLDGYVRNCDDATVEVEAAGEAAAVEQLRVAVAHGPPHARVRELQELPPGREPLPRPFSVLF
jgi:acylphosphatase